MPPAEDAVGDEEDGLAGPRVVEVVDGVLEGAGDAVVVLGAHHHVAVVLGDLGGPGDGVLVGELGVGGDGAGEYGLVEDGEVEGGEVEDGEGGVEFGGGAWSGGGVEDCFYEGCDGRADAHGARGAYYEGDFFGGEGVGWGG